MGKFLDKSLLQLKDGMGEGRKSDFTLLFFYCKIFTGFRIVKQQWFYIGSSFIFLGRIKIEV